MKNLATIQTIKNIRVHTNSDKLELADVLGWQVVVKKGEFNPGDQCIYIVTDTILPEKPEFEFLRTKHFRIKPIRLRGQSSNGICFPLSILPTVPDTQDVTDLIGVMKYEKPISTQLAGNAVGHIPGFLIVTDEDNLRSYPNALAELHGQKYYITRKDDGSSGTFFINENEFGVCSRRVHLKEDPNNGFWKMAHKYNIEHALRNSFPLKNVAVQGEVVGPGIQKNPMGLSELEYHVFGLLDISTRRYLSYSDLCDFCKNNNIPMVTILNTGDEFKFSLQELIDMANVLKYPNNKPAEGLVVRPQFDLHSPELNKQWSGKIINEFYEDES